MTLSHVVLALAAAAAPASAVFSGFNYGSTFTDGSAKMQSDYESDFKTAAGLQGTDGEFTSARFYTMIVSFNYQFSLLPPGCLDPAHAPDV